MSAYDEPAAPEQLFGRAQELGHLTLMIARREPGCLIFTGMGGIGKTRLLRELQAYLASQGRRPPPIYDFYHSEHFKASQIELAIVESVQALIHGNEFSPYLELRAKLERRRQSGDGVVALRAELRAMFVACYNRAAQRAARLGRMPVLLFDTVEQAVYLSDPAEERMSRRPADPNDGGEHWLSAILPQLQHTLIVLSGRPTTLYNQPVALYDALEHSMGAMRYPLEGIPATDVAGFMAELRERMLAAADPTMRAQAHMIDLRPAWLDVYAAVSDGQPFWLDMLFVGALFAYLPPAIDELYLRRYEAGTLQLSIAERENARSALMYSLLGRYDEQSGDQIRTLQWLASARRGLSLEMLQAIADQECADRPFDVAAVFASLQRLLIVKRRFQRPDGGEAQPNDPDASPLLFLHDEMYFWLDRDKRGALSLRPQVLAALLGWYNQAIERAEQERLAAIRTALTLTRNSPAAERLRAQAAQADQRRRQLELDRLGYAYQQSSAGGRAEYNLRAYLAIVNREYGYSDTLRQEALRSLYRADGVSPEEEIECAGRWILRAVWAEDAAGAMAMLARATPYLEQAVGMPRALLQLSLARALQDGDPDRRHAEILDRLADAERQIGPVAPGDTWAAVLLAQIQNYRGLAYRRVYSLPASIAAYRASMNSGTTLPSVRSWSELAKTLNNLAFALSEQGEVSEARRLARQALRLNEEYSSAYFIALSYNTLARIEIRAGQPWRAQQHATRARSILRRIDSMRGLLMNLPVLAESYRKIAEQLDDDLAVQRRFFARAVQLFSEARAAMGEQAAGERRRETLQGLGCTYRSLGQALRRHNPADPQAVEAFVDAFAVLSEARATAEASGQPPLIMLDLIEDLAVVLVNANCFDSQIEALLREAEAYAPPEYRLRRGGGLALVHAPLRGYWRELGQCEIQRMLSGFGAFDMGFYGYTPPATPIGALFAGRSAAPLRYHDPADLHAAGYHMVLAFAYLYHYDRAAPMTERAVYLALRELRHGRSEAQIRLMLGAARRAAADYAVAPEVIELVEQLMLQALNDQPLAIGRPAAE